MAPRSPGLRAACTEGQTGLIWADPALCQGPADAAETRARALGLPFPGTTGPLNAITDVPGLRVGFCTLTDPARLMRTGVTAILPRDEAGDPSPVWAGFHALNGNGEMTGVHWVNDAGYFIGPILITNTHGVGAAHEGATRWMIRRYAAISARTMLGHADRGRDL